MAKLFASFFSGHMVDPQRRLDDPSAAKGEIVLNFYRSLAQDARIEVRTALADSRHGQQKQMRIRLFP